MKLRITAEIFCLVGIIFLAGVFGTFALVLMCTRSEPALGLAVVTLGQALTFEIPTFLLWLIHIIVLIYLLVFMCYLHNGIYYHTAGYAWGIIVSALVIALFDLFTIMALTQTPVITEGEWVALLIFFIGGLVIMIAGGFLVMFVKEQYRDAGEDEIGFVDYDEMARKYRVNVTLNVDPIFKSNLEIKMDNKIITPKEYCDAIKLELRKNSAEQE